jgi:HNH endonuclease
MTPTPDRKGYLSVKFTQNGQRVLGRGYIHAEVLMAFVGPRPEGLDACHNDGHPQNNHVTNLRWDTRLANNRDILKHGTHNNVNKRYCPRGHLLTVPNLVVNHNGRTCLSCSRAQSHCYYHGTIKGRDVNFVDVANRYYTAVMAGRPKRR